VWRDAIRDRVNETDLASAVEDAGSAAVWVTDDGRIVERSLSGPAGS
jgi:hypothetical protein